MPQTTPADYSTVTELPGARASQQQLDRLRHRYALAATLSASRDVLEVGCGAGLGLGWLARRARRVTGGDFTAASLLLARRHYNGRVPLLRLDAARLPFRDGSFDAVILFETLYYLERPPECIAECARVLRPGGLLLIGAVNPESSGFHPSPFAQQYFSAQALEKLLNNGGFSAELFGGFEEAAQSPPARLLTRLKRIAGRAGLIPKTMRGRELLKRLVFGALTTLPAEILPNGYAYEPPKPIHLTGPWPTATGPRPTTTGQGGSRRSPAQRDYTILYGLGRRQPPSQLQSQP
jgi:SAM-dependent methyltransferase